MLENLQARFLKENIFLFRKIVDEIAYILDTGAITTYALCGEHKRTCSSLMNFKNNTVIFPVK
jgi:hypothetical protein